MQAVLSTNDIKLGHIMKYSTERWSRKSGADSDFELEPVTLGRRQHVVGSNLGRHRFSDQYLRE